MDFSQKYSANTISRVTDSIKNSIDKVLSIGTNEHVYVYFPKKLITLLPVSFTFNNSGSLTLSTVEDSQSNIVLVQCKTVFSDQLQEPIIIDIDNLCELHS